MIGLAPTAASVGLGAAAVNRKNAESNGRAARQRCGDGYSFWVAQTDLNRPFKITKPIDADDKVETHSRLFISFNRNYQPELQSTDKRCISLTSESGNVRLSSFGDTSNAISY